MQKARLAVLFLSLSLRTGPKIHAQTHVPTHVTRHAFSSRLLLKSAGTKVFETIFSPITLREAKL